MTPEEFISVLEHGDFIEDAVFQQMLEKYPYAQGLRLAYLKQLQKYNPDAYEKELPKMATYAPSRTDLYYTLKQQEVPPKEILPLPVLVKEELELQAPETIVQPELVEVTPEVEKPIEQKQSTENEYTKIIRESTGLGEEEKTESDLQDLEELEASLNQIGEETTDIIEEETETMEDNGNLLLQQIIIDNQRKKHQTLHQKEHLPKEGFVSLEDIEALDDEVETGIMEDLNVDKELFAEKEDHHEYTAKKSKKHKLKKVKAKHKKRMTDKETLFFAFVEDSEVQAEEETEIFSDVDEIIPKENLLVFNDEITTPKPKKVGKKSLNKSAKKSSKKQKKKAHIKEILEKVADESLEEDEILISETLAHILAIQGKKANAIKMYQQLILTNPQKSDYFAQKIQQLLEED